MHKICHVTSAHKSTDVRIFHKQCTGLAKAGYDVYLVAQGDSRVENGVNIVGVGDHTGGRLNRMTQMTKKVYKKALELDCEVYHLHDPELLPYALKLKKKGKKVVFDSHEDFVNNIKEKPYLNKHVASAISVGFDILQKHVVARLDALIYVTPHMKKNSEELNSKSIMITNYPVVSTDNINEHKKTDNQLVFAGGVEPLWSHVEILKAISNVDAVYKVCGKGPKEYIAAMKAADVRKRLDYIGLIKHTEVKSLLWQSFAGMAILKYHLNVGGKTGTLGNTKIFEYMMAGLPIICTDFILWKEIVDKYNCGICVCPDNIDEITNAVKYLLDNKDKASEMGRNARRAVEQEYNWANEESKLVALYKELTSG